MRSIPGAQAWRGQTTGAVLPRASLRTFSKGQMLSPDAVIRRLEAPRTIPPIPYADRFRPLQILARDPAGNQYT